MGTGERNGQCALLVCGQPEDKAKEHEPLNGSAHLTCASTKEGKGREPQPSRTRFPRATRG